MQNKKIQHLSLFLIGLLFFLTGCDKMFRERKVDKSELLGYDYRLFQGTKSWEIAKAVWDDDKKAIKSLLTEDKSLLNSTDPVMGHSLLMFTLWNQQYKTFKYLLELGADVNIHDHYEGSSAIIDACKMEQDNADYVKLLLQHGANVNDVEVRKRQEGNTTRDSPLLAACRKGKMELVKLLIESGADLNYKNEYNQSALNQATIQQNYNVVLFLLERGVDYNLPITYNEEQNKTYYLVDELRFYMPDLNSSEYKLKMEIVSFLRSKGIEYKDVPIPEYVIQKAKKRYPDNWEDYLKKY